jgi:carboxypeptidase Taq
MKWASTLPSGIALARSGSGILSGTMSYKHLEERFRRLGHLYHVAEILQWDEAVIMPAAAGPERAAAMGTLHEVLHEWTTDPRLVGWLEEAADGTLTAVERANLREMSRIVRRAQALPTEFVSHSTRVCMAC